MDGIAKIATRMFVRSARVITGLVIAIIGAMMVSSGWDDLSKPLGQSSLLGLVGGLALVAIGLSALVWAWAVAFGEGPRE